MVQAGMETMLFDCGQGVYDRLIQTGNLGIDRVFISHLHSDHIGDLGALFAVGALYRYVNPNDPAADDPLKVYGPAGSANQPVPTWAMMQAFRSAYDTDFYVRQLFTNPNDFSLTNAAVETLNSTTEIAPGVVYQNNGVTVTAFLVDHNPMMPAYGYRVDYAGHSFVYSGDTTFSTNLIANAQHVDLLVHEVYGYPRDEGPEIYDYHTSPEAAAVVFLQTQPTQAVFTHLVIPPGTTANELVSRTRAAGYTGPLTPGVDLMVINVNSDFSVTIKPPAGGSAPTLSERKATSDFIEIARARQRRQVKQTTITK